MKIAQVIEELVEEHGLDRSLLISIVCEGIGAAYEKKYPELQFKITYDKKSDEIEVAVQKQVVPVVADEEREISTRRAHGIDPKAEAGASLWVPFEGKIGRIEILRAKQIIASKIRGVEAAAIFNQFKDKRGTIVHGVIHKCEYGGMTVKIGEALAFLPKSAMIPTDKCVVGYTVKVLLKEVFQEPRNDYQLILDRASSDFVHRLFELEIPEIFEGLVEIKKIARIAGYKTKIAVVSHDENIDPVGTCVGVGGVRIQPILKEIGGEKIDVIAWSDSAEDRVSVALKPAVVNRVEFVDDKNALVWVDEDQRSLAIGKMGQNIALASQLAGVNIKLVQNEKRNEDASIVVDEPELEQ